MEPLRCELKDGRALLIRRAAVEDARPLLEYIHSIGAESDFLTFGLGEFEVTLAEEEKFVQDCLQSDNRLYLLALLGETIAGTLFFTGGRRPRIRHSGELGMTVRKQYWGLGIGGLLLDTLIDWAKRGGIIRKIDLRVRTDNSRAIALYERKGFVREGTLRRQIFLDGRYYDHYWMGLELPGP
jgi:RimJ/RimL family protein N-acetyltransferase